MSKLGVALTTSYGCGFILTVRAWNLPTLLFVFMCFHSYVFLYPFIFRNVLLIYLLLLFFSFYHIPHFVV